MSDPHARTHALPPRLSWALGVVIGGTLAYCIGLQMMLEDQSFSSTMISSGLWRKVVAIFGGEVKANPAANTLTAVVPFFRLLLINGIVSLATWLAGAAWLSRKRGEAYTDSLAFWGWRGWPWLLLPFVWQIMWLVALGGTWIQFVTATTPFWLTISCAGWGATFFTLAAPPEGFKAPNVAPPLRVPWALWLGIALFVGCFFSMNLQLYNGLQTPHGDSAMYEEHLWNLTHGKGFRSFLDYNTDRQPPEFRLFLGEHIQVVHVLLLPVYLVWRSHLTLELCETLALASGALAVFFIGQRHSGSRRSAAILAGAYLLYFPLHFLDIEIDFKTFRPICFGVPAILFALDQWERGRVKTMLLLLALALSAKEDYAMIIAPLGIWIALHRQADAANSIPRQRLWWLGGCLAVFGVLYLMFVIKFAIPYFRGGDVHYVRYFPEDLGATPGEMVRTVFIHPLRVAGYLFTPGNLLFALCLLLPLGGVPLLSPTRLAVAAPLFAVLCLNQIARDTQHHFHAPLIPILFWAAAASLTPIARFRPRWAFACALGTGLFFSLGPTGIAFWDPASTFYWQRWYEPGERSEKFAEVSEQISAESKVASTDFVHPRFTHYARSYDYSDYRPVVPDDTDYIVIDTRHRYSNIKLPSQVKEFRDSPQAWELLPDRTDGYFIVLRRRR